MRKLLKGDHVKNNIINIREEAELTQSDMAEILKVSQSNYSRWETGKEFIPLSKLNALCNYFCTSMDYALGLSNKNNFKTKNNFSKSIIGKNLKIFRKNKKITQKELSEFLNTSQSTISAYEAGKTTLLTSFAYQICNEYKISLDWLCANKK